MSFNFQDVTKALESTNVSSAADQGVSFEGKNLKLNTADDAKPLVNAINSCKDLVYLNLAGNTLGVEASEALAKALEKHPEFKRALWKDLFTGRLKEEIPKALQFLGNGLVVANARLTELDLSDNAFGPIGVQGLASLLRSSSCYNLKELRLNNNGLGISGGKMLANALMDCYKCSKAQGTPLELRVFIAGRNRLENDGARALAEVFKTIGTFEEIAMPQNGIYHQGITALSEAFAQNKNLRIINLNDNTLGPKGAQALAKALPHLQNLTSINFGDCLLKTKGAQYIAEAIKQNNLLLEELNLDYNEINSEGGIAIAKAVCNKPNLRTLLLDGNQFGEEGREAMENIIRDSGNSEALGSLEADESEEEESENEENETEDESEDDDEQDVQEDQCEDVQEQDDDVQEQDDDVHVVENKVELPRLVTVTVKEFLASPTADKFMALGKNRYLAILEEVKRNPKEEEDTFFERFVPVVMKVSALAACAEPGVAKAALETSDHLYRALFTWTQTETQLQSLLNNSLLVHLGLIKSEDKKYKPTWNVDGCMLALEAALKQKYVPSATQDTLKVFLNRCSNTDSAPSPAKTKLIAALKN